MRIAVLNWTSRKAGGIEVYLHSVVPALDRLGHRVAFWHEIDAPADRELIALPPDSPRWCAATTGADAALSALRDWRPDLIFAHGLLDPALEERFLSVAPALFFAHAYYGTCVSGEKSFKRPQVTPCSRRFGLGCLLQYYPRRCGGLNPLTMLREYRLHARRLRTLRRCRAIATFSEHMRREYLNHGFAPERVTALPYHPPAERPRAAPLPLAGEGHGPWQLLFLGRMELLKGGQVLLEALPLVRAALPGQPLHVTLAGDGRDRAAWERQAARLQGQDASLTIAFTGWVGGERLEALYDEADLVVVPSLWPEPFGLVGPEAAQRGVPVAAFSVGGISEWLRDGVNGHLTPGDPPTPAGLAEAIVKCLRDPVAHARLRRGAAEVAAGYSAERHLAALQQLFEDVLRDRPAARRPDGVQGPARAASLSGSDSSLTAEEP
jgi:glycosyltransferase involved in cell wall biosynthesis